MLVYSSTAWYLDPLSRFPANLCALSELSQASIILHSPENLAVSLSVQTCWVEDKPRLFTKGRPLGTAVLWNKQMPFN